MKIKTIPYPTHLVLLINEKESVIRLKLSAAVAALLSDALQSYLKEFPEAQRPTQSNRPLIAIEMIPHE